MFNNDRINVLEHQMKTLKDQLEQQDGKIDFFINRYSMFNVTSETPNSKRTTCTGSSSDIKFNSKEYKMRAFRDNVMAVYSDSSCVLHLNNHRYMESVHDFLAVIEKNGEVLSAVKKYISCIDAEK